MAMRGALLGGTAQFKTRLAHYTMNLLPHTADTYSVHVMRATGMFLQLTREVP